MLKVLFGGAKARGAVGRKAHALEARLSPVVSGAGRGEIEYTAWRDGAKQLEIELRAMSGDSAEIYIAGERITTVMLEKGRADLVLDTRKDGVVPDLVLGASVEVRQRGELLLGGIFLHD